MGRAKLISYAAYLKAQQALYEDARQEAAPISLTEYKARQDVQRWRERFATEASQPAQGCSPPDPASPPAGGPRFLPKSIWENTFLAKRLPWRLFGGEA